MLEVTYLGVPVKVCSFIGKVVDNNKQLETIVSGSGGGGTIYNGKGTLDPINIHSTTAVHDHFFLIDENGTEISVKLIDWNVSLRNEHTINIIWAISGKKTTGPYVAINNQNLNDVIWNDTALKYVVASCLTKHLLIGLVASIILGYLTSNFSLFFFGLIATFIYFYIQRGILAKDLKSKINEKM